MNPFSLLKTGRALRGVADGGHYKMVPRSVVPNFSAGKPARISPTLPQRASEPVQPALFEAPKPVRVHVPEKPKAEAAVVVPPQAPRVVHAVRVIPPTPSAIPAVPAPVAVGPVKAEPNGPSFWAKLAEAAVQLVRQWKPGRKASPFHTGVQTELALDRVKVIRNDLIEDDLEVVAVNPKTGKETRVVRVKKADHAEVRSQDVARDMAKEKAPAHP